jgi:cyclopropane-fatty-acyl-phospholipid synthase
VTRGQWAARRVVQLLLSRIFVGRLTVVEGGVDKVFGPGGGDGPRAVVHVKDPAGWPLLLKGSSGLAESYARGHWDTPDLPALIRIAARNTTELDAVRRRLSPLREPFQRLRSVRSTEPQSRKDISSHYDLGNDLFELMLDPTMMYSSAYFAEPGMSLEQASAAKLDLVCSKLDLGEHDHVLEIGTGWGGFAVHAAATTGCRVTTTTISRRQYEWAVERVHDAGVQDRVEVLLRDYRTLEGAYDKLVSIEMIEAVGWRDFGTFFERCSRLLKPSGTMLLQAITIDDRAYELEKASKSFIRSYVFPNGCLPSNEVIARSLRRHTDLRLVGLQDLTPHYAETLRHWRHNVEAAAGRLHDLGYDERFRRIWRLYLAYCEAGFTERRISVVQSVLAKPLWRAELPDVAAVRRLHAAG